MQKTSSLLRRLHQKDSKIMKLRLVTSLAAAFFCVCSFAQKAYTDIAEDINKAGGVYYVDDFSIRDNTPAPKGYTPFYISTYSRHGARYILEEGQYTNIRKAFTQAYEAGNLTEKGQDFYSRFESLYNDVRLRAGELTPLGRKQQKEIARRLYDTYPQIFGNSPHIEAYSTNVVRAIMSMNAFCEGLKEKDRLLAISQEASKANLDWLNPFSSSAPSSQKFDRTMKSIFGGWYKEVRKMTAEKVDIDAVIGKLFKDASLVKEDHFTLMNDLFDLASDMQNIGGEMNFWDLFTAAEARDIWECQNFRYYAKYGSSPMNYGRSPALSWGILEDIISKGDSDMASYPSSVRLRFGHDGCLISLLSLMGADSWGKVTEDREEIKNFWLDYNIPMAANLQFIFYKGKTGDVLVKALLNEKNMTLPFESVEGPYYRWADFKNYYGQVIEKAKETLSVSEPVILTGKVTCDGRGVGGVQVSDGKTFTKTDAEGNYSMFSDKGQGFVFITTPSGYVATSEDGIRPDFWATLTEPYYKAENHDFTLKKENQANYSIIFFTDAHLTNADFKPDLQTFSSLAMPRVRSVAAELSSRGPVYTINFGDLAHERYWYKYNYNLEDAYNTLKKENYPTLMYSISGNHDNDGAISTSNTDRDAEYLYRKIFGPEFYSVNIGREHWIMMDDVIYINNPVKQSKDPGIVGDRSYVKGFTAEEMEWLANDLKSLPDTAHIRLCTHVPIIFDNAKETLFRTSQMDSLASMFRRFGTVYIQCGHVHRMQFLESEKYPMFKEAALPAISGDMWTSSPVITIGTDGEDGGVLIGKFYSDKTPEYQYYTDMYGEKWMRVYDMNAVRDYYANDPDIRREMETYPDMPDYADPKYTNCVYVNYWYYKPGETVEILESGKPLTVAKVKDDDPVRNVNKAVPSFKRSPKYKESHAHPHSRHMFAAKASKAKTPIVVRVRDKEGKIIYEEKLVRPKAFSPDMQ